MQSQLVGVHHIEASKSAFAAIKVQAGVDACVPGVAGVAGVQVKLKSGVVTWGDQAHGGDSSHVQDRLQDIVQLKATKSLAFVYSRNFSLMRKRIAHLFV